MAKKIRFPLKMKNGLEVRTINELRENFSLESVLIYLFNGRLETWLRDRYVNDLAEVISKLNLDDGELPQKICAIFDVKCDEAKVLYWSKKSVAERWCNIGIFYWYGIDVDKDEVKAFCSYEKAADQGHAEGEYRLGVCYEKGMGIGKDEEKAFNWYKKSAEQGNGGGQLGMCYCYGKGIGVVKDEEKAFFWFEKFAKQGDVVDHYLLEDTEKMVYLISKLVELGIEAAGKMFKRLSSTNLHQKTPKE